MKRGFLNTARFKRAIEEAYAPQSPPSGRPKLLRAPSPRLARESSQTRPGGSDSNEAVIALEDGGAMGVDSAAEMPAVAVLQEVYADGHVVAVRVVRSADSEGKAGNPSTLPRLTQGGGEEVAPVQDVADVQMTEFQNIYVDGRVVGVRVVRCTVGEADMPPGLREDDHGTQAEPHRDAKDSKGKGKEKIVSDDATIMSGHNCIVFLPQRALRRNPPGWGRHPDEEFFHTAHPQSYGGRWEKRAVFRVWPRDPNGEPIHLSESYMGTLSPDGYPWAATLYDIYYVNRLPDVPDFVSVMTGSALRKAVEAMGELNAAASEIEWAKSEGKPRVEGAACTAESIKCLDSRLRLQRGLLPFLDPREETERKQNEGQDTEDVAEQTPTKDDDGDEDTKIPPQTTPVTSPLRPNYDPERWPFTPFEHQLSILLQEPIPIYLLPQTLYVHDPFCLLTARRKSFSDTSWTSQPDIVRTYNLHLSETARQKCEDVRKEAEELEEFKSRTLIFLRYQRTKEQIKNYEPIIEVLLPHHARRPTMVDESHLYLSPVAKVGQGHHSIVYKGEWELPRDIFMKQEICSLCFKESVDKEIQRLKDIGRWDKILRAASWGATGFTGRQPTQGELDEVNDLTDLEMPADGEILEREITCVVPPDADPPKIAEMIDKTNIWDMLMKQRDVHAALLDFTEDESMKDSCVAVVRVDPPFSHESQKSCIHHLFQGPAPLRTAMFTVVAKLSFEDDPHLVREASNYQMFPDRFFEHYDGYTVIDQLHATVPVNAIAPQFYGYYVPETSQTKGETPQEPPYLSPILLLEHCGEPIDPWKLSNEDQEECASLLLRFQRAGWLHESVATRNFLVQRGKPTELPLTRTSKPESSFRLIDFGRSRECDNSDEKRTEEEEALRLFGKLSTSMAVTLGREGRADS